MNFSCNICNKVLKCKTSLNGHRRRFHPANEQEKIKCATCNKNFSRVSDMKRHTAKFHIYEAKDKLSKTKDSETSMDGNNCVDTETDNLPTYEQMATEEINSKSTTDGQKNKLLDEQQSFLLQDFIDGLSLKYEIDLPEIANAQKRNAEYIRINAENILKLLNTQNYHNSQIKKIEECLTQSITSESNKKVFNCNLCNKNFSSKGSLYSHKIAIIKKE